MMQAAYAVVAFWAAAAAVVTPALALQQAHTLSPGGCSHAGTFWLQRGVEYADESRMLSGCLPPLQCRLSKQTVVSIAELFLMDLGHADLLRELRDNH